MLKFTKQNSYTLEDLRKYGVDVPVIFHNGSIFSVAPRSLYNTLHDSYFQFIDQLDPFSTDGDEMALARTADDVRLVSIRTVDRIVTFLETEASESVAHELLEFGMVYSDLSIMVQSVGPLDFNNKNIDGSDDKPVNYNADFDMIIGSMVLSLPSLLARRGSDMIIQSLNNEIERLHDDYQRQIFTLRDQVQLKQQRVNELEEQINNLEQVIGTMQDNVPLIEELQRAKLQLEEQLAGARLEVDNLNERIRQLESEHATKARAMQDQIDSLRSKLIADAWSYSAEIASLKEENARLRSEVLSSHGQNVSRSTSVAVTALAAATGVFIGRSVRDQGVKIINVKS